MAKLHYKQRGNGQGSITKVSGRKKPYRVRITDGFEFDKESGKAVAVIKNLGYFATKAEAEAKLAEFLKCPYDLDKKDITFAELYAEWSKGYFKTLKSESSIRTVTAAYAYCSGLYKMRMIDIKSHHLSNCMSEGTTIETRGRNKGKVKHASPSTQARMKSLFNLMFDYAMEHEIVTRNYARMFEINEDILDEIELNKKKKMPLSYDDLMTLWNSVGEYPFIDMVLVNIYTGFRPNELATIKLEDVDLEQGFIRGGSKTLAGKNRLVPIHPAIKDMIERQYSLAMKHGCKTLYFDVDSQTDIDLI